MNNLDCQLYSLLNIRKNISRRLQWAEHVASMREARNAYKIFVGKP